MRGEHGLVTQSQAYSAWRLDALVGEVNISTIHVAFRNGTVRDTSFFTAGQALADSRSAGLLAASTGGSTQDAFPRLQLAEPAGDVSGFGVPGIMTGTGLTYVAGCAQASEEPLGLIGVDLAWVTDPEYAVSLVGTEVINNITTEHWSSPKCRDIWVLPTSAGPDRAGLPVRVLIRAISAAVNFGCQPPTQQADYAWISRLASSSAGTSSPLFMPPAQCFPSQANGPGSGGADDTATPVWVWGVLGSVLCLVLGAAGGFLVAACRRQRWQQDPDEPRERFSSHLLDVI